VAWIIAGGLLLILMRFGYLQIVEVSRYRAAAKENGVKLFPLAAPRGEITDRNGEILATSRPSFRVSLVPRQLPEDEAGRDLAVSRIASLMAVEPGWLAGRVIDSEETPLTPIRLKGGLTPQEVAELEERHVEFPGLLIEEEPLRLYPFGTMASHLLGYIGEVNLDELHSYGSGYIPGDLVGKTGVEQSAERFLKGLNGGLEVEVDAMGHQIRMRGRRPPKPGYHVVLTLDRRIQQRCEELLGDRAGAIVVMEARTGEILAMASNPRFDPNWFGGGGISWLNWQKLSSDAKCPMQNRATQALYSPGSIFKIVTASAALETGELNEEKTYECAGVFWIKTWPYKCWNELAGHGWMNVQQALTHSCDIFFYKTGLSLKVDLLAKYADMFGFGEVTGVDLPGESAGFVPTREWKERLFHIPWFPGNTVQMSIGQGYLIGTPLQLIQLMNITALEGRAMRPHVLKRVEDQQGQVVSEVVPQVSRRISLAPTTWALVRTSLWRAVNFKGGTGYKCHMEELDVCGKTSTIQNPQGEDHAAFGAYAPADDPQVVVVTFIEHGLAGGGIAALITKSVLQTWNAIRLGKPLPSDEGPVKLDLTPGPAGG